MYDVAIIGAGASGLMCASYLAYLQRKGDIPSTIKTVVIERNPKPGKKLLLTGSGRCNLTNLNASYSDYNTDSKEVLHNILDGFTPDDLLLFAHEELGIDTVSRESLVYPVTYRSATVLDALRFYLDDKKTELITGQKVTEIKREGNLYRLCLDSGVMIEAGFVVIAAGGMSYPKTGSDGNGFYLFAGDKVASLIRPIPALVPLITSDKDIKTLSGTSVTAKITVHTEKETFSEEGTLLFTDYGISGICVMILSGLCIASAQNNGKFPRITIDLLSQYDQEKAALQVINRIRKFPDRRAVDALSGLVRSNILIVIFKRAKVNTDILCRDLNEASIRKLIDLLTAFPVSVIGNTGFDNSQVTRGGLSLGDLGEELCDPNGIYYCGEIVNVDGPCGGYNLQWAWASAVRVAVSIGKKL